MKKITNPKNSNLKELQMDNFLNSSKKLTPQFEEFTGKEQRVNQAGKTLGDSGLLVSQGVVVSLAGLGRKIQGQLGPLKRRIRSLKPLFLITIGAGVLLFPESLIAHEGDLLKTEITAVEKLFTGGYMRLGLIAVCGFAAIYGIIKQSGWIFCSGILGCLFAYLMRDWILKTFTMVI
jgi:hypothetical protein